MDLFLDCDACDQGYIKQEFASVNYVRAQQDAMVHLLVTRQGTAGGGATYELQFIGKHEYEGMNSQLFYSATPNDSPDIVRKGLLKMIQIGLLPYMARNGLKDEVTISITAPKDVPVNVTNDHDPWGHWIFQINANGNMDLESLRKKYAVRTGLEADHVTDQWRVRFRAYSNYNRTEIEGDGETFVSERRNQGSWGSFAYSLGDHLSVGGGGSFFQDSYQNIDYHFSVAPAIEYNFFPYQEVMRRELTLAYRLKGLYQDYALPTIYERSAEWLAQQELMLELRLRQPWGQVFTGLEGSHYFNDPSRFRASVNANVDLRVFKGLNFRVSGNVRLIHDQISLAAGESSLEDLLLQQRQLATDYEMGLYAGLSYTFGSMYNNIVNTRL